MTSEEKRRLIERYLDAYNRFDIDGMLALIHPDIEFKNLSGGQITAAASGIDAFRDLADQSTTLFSSRRQQITDFSSQDDRATIQVAYEGVLAVDLPNGLQAGETLALTGRSEFTFREGKIISLTDIS